MGRFWERKAVWQKIQAGEISCGSARLQSVGLSPYSFLHVILYCFGLYRYKKPFIMYANFIYFILVLLIYTTYHPPENPYLGPLETLGMFLLGVGILAITTRAAFGVLSKKIALRGSPGLHGEFDRLFRRQAILAIIIFAINIYVLNLKFFFLTIPPFPGSPTLMHGPLVYRSFYGLPFNNMGGSLRNLWSPVSNQTLQAILRAFQYLL
jgi:hypothetical protein